jgi:Uma2 family endonuclease
MMSTNSTSPDPATTPFSQASTIWNDLPESKLELIDGRLIAGNSLAGSRYLLWAILQLLGPQAALGFAPPDRWWSAVATAYLTPPLLASPQAWERWAAGVSYNPRVAPAGSRFTWEHHDAFGQLMLGLSLALRDSDRIGSSIQRFTMRLGEDAFLPDLQCFRRDRLHHLQTYYFDGPADVVIEVTLPGAEVADTQLKRRRYAAGGVPEYWILDPAAQTWTFLQLVGDTYAPQPLDADGRYRSTSIPGLVCDPARLWPSLDQKSRQSTLDTAIFAVEDAHVAIGPRTTPNDEEAWTWEWRPLTQPIDLRPTPISFEQYLSWCPEPKFELIDGRPYIGGWEGTRNVLGMLLMTFGLTEVVQLLHPSAWVAALAAEEAAHLRDDERRDAWWGVAR